MKKSILLLLLFPFLSYAQNSNRMSPQELSAMPSYLQQASLWNHSGITQPPSTAVRASAEWEEIDALMIAWTGYSTILSQIAHAAQTETKVIIICSDSNAVKNTLTSNGVPFTNIDYLIAPFNSIWCRDYGQWNIYRQDVDSLALIDWTYNRPRPKDDTVPSSIMNYTGLPMYETTTAPNDLIHTGGNFMCDGFGTGFSSKLIINENPTKTEAQIDSIMSQFMGINRYIKMEVLPYDGIHHIDMHMKLLDEETILMGLYPAAIADGPQIEANLQYVLSNFNSVYGTPYKVVRIPMPPDANNLYPNNSNADYRTFTNSVFVNKTIILPFYDTQYDTIARRIYEEALPGYKVVGIDCNSIIPSLGAIHCITKEIAARDPLLISHQPLHDTYNTTIPYTVTARIQHASGIQQAYIYYTTDTAQPWQSVSMNNTGGYNWSGDIPAQVGGSIVYYYIEGRSVSGKTQVRPMPAPSGFWKFNVLLNSGISNTASVKIDFTGTFPNPSHGITCIPVVTPENTEINITLKNVLGQTVIPVFNGVNTGEKKYFMNTSSTAPGVYLLEMVTKECRYSQTIIVR